MNGPNREDDAMRTSQSRAVPVSRAVVGALAGFVLAAAVLCTGAVAPATAPAATVSGVLKGAVGYKVLLVQANGKARKATIRTSAGSFSIRGVKPAGATLQLVGPDGSYYGPAMLKTTATRAFGFIRGASSLKLGALTLKGGYALARRAPLGRYQTLATTAAKAARGRPIGAGKLGRVRTANPMGLRGPGADLDLDGVVSAFDIDDNGNLLLDNVDRTGRGAGRPTVAGFRGGASAASASRAGGEPLGPPPLDTTGQFYLFSNFWPTAVGPWTALPAASINANIAAIAGLDALIDRYMPMALSLAMEAPDGTPAQLDGLDNSYVAEHVVDGVTYPLVGLDYATPTYASPGLLDLIPDPRHPSGCPLKPGALAAEIGGGDCFVMTTSSGARYPGTLNFAFNTAPALKSYQFDTDAQPTEIVYDTDAVQNPRWPSGAGRRADRGADGAGQGIVGDADLLASAAQGRPRRGCEPRGLGRYRRSLVRRGSFRPQTDYRRAGGRHGERGGRDLERQGQRSHRPAAAVGGWRARPGRRPAGRPG